MFEYINLINGFCQIIIPNTVNSGGGNVCVNTIGSFVCYCKNGYLDLNGDGNECRDIDECRIANPCSAGYASCFNVPGWDQSHQKSCFSETRTSIKEHRCIKNSFYSSVFEVLIPDKWFV